MDRVFVYKAPDDTVSQIRDGSNILLLAPGLDNFAAGVCSHETTFILDGRKTKRISQ